QRTDAVLDQHPGVVRYRFGQSVSRETGDELRHPGRDRRPLLHPNPPTPPCPRLALPADLYTLRNTVVNRGPRSSEGCRMTTTTPVVIGGFGNVGEQIARRILGDRTGTLEIAAIAARDHDKARAKAEGMGLSAPVISADQAPRYPGVLVECSTYESFRAVVEPTLRAGGHVIAISVGALAANMDLIDLTRESGATLQIAGGTLPGLDILRAAREGEIQSVRLTSHIHPASFAKEPYIAEHGIDLDPAKREPVPVFSGSAREAARHFPR